MPVHRYYVPNAIVFITQTVANRAPIFCEPRWVGLLRATLHRVQELHPFIMHAYVFLPDHFHLLIQPAPPQTHSSIMHSLKPAFTLAYKQALGITGGSLQFWQRSFYDHLIRDERDFEQHLHYIHFNPVKHGLAARPEDWPHSSLAARKTRGAYPEMWRWSLEEWTGAIGAQADGNGEAGYSTP